jgi:hypothetical protein
MQDLQSSPQPALYRECRLLQTVALAFWCLVATLGQAEPPPPGAGSGKGAGPRVGPITQLEITVTNRADLERLVQGGYDVDAVKGNQVTLYADNDELAGLQSAGWQMTPVPPAPVPLDLGAYNNYSNLTVMLNAYATNYPLLCRKLSVGKSGQNRDLWALKVTTNPDVPADKPKFTYISTIHGNEPVGTEMSLYLIDLLLKGYGSNDTRIVNLLSNVEIWFLPLMNPDGRESNPPQRYNAAGYDLNRSFPEGSGTNLGNNLYGPPMNTNGLPIEVGLVMTWTAARHFTLGANFHTGSLVVNYPYDNDGLGSTLSPSPDDALFQAMSLAYASNNLPMWNSASFPNGIVNGAAWYVVIGGMQDWNYRYQGGFHVTIELSNSQWPNPPASQLPTYWSQNRESMLSYLEWVLRGVRGVLRDAQTGQPLSGAVLVEGYHHLVLSDPAVGDYHRLLLPGTYNLWFSAPGYEPQRVPNMVVGVGAATRLDVALRPVSTRFAAKINFAPATAAVPTGFLVDSGAGFGARGGGYSYGWETPLPSGYLLERKAARSQDLRYDTLCQMQAGGNHTWEIAVPNGPYSVHLAAGDPAFSTGMYRISAENVLLLDGAPSASNWWVEALGTVVVTDGRLTLTSAAGATSNRLAYVEISAVEPTNIAQWRARFFGTTNNTGAAADNADLDGDGLPNLLEYALGLDPTLADAGPQFAPVLVHTNNADWFGGSFLRNTNATDLAFRVQASASLPAPAWSDIAAWTNGPGWTGPGLAWETSAASNRAAVTVLDAQPFLTGTNRFLRLSVTRP